MRLLILFLVSVVWGQVIAYSPSGSLRLAVYPEPHGKTRGVVLEGATALLVRQGSYLAVNGREKRSFIIGLDALVFYSGGDLILNPGNSLYYGIDAERIVVKSRKVGTLVETKRMTIGEGWFYGLIAKLWSKF